jgi:hypothetical protein
MEKVKEKEQKPTSGQKERIEENHKEFRGALLSADIQFLFIRFRFLIRQELFAIPDRAMVSVCLCAADPIIPQAPGALAIRSIAIHRQPHAVPPFPLCLAALSILSCPLPLCSASVHLGHLPSLYIPQLTSRVPPPSKPAKIARSSSASKIIILIFLLPSQK